METKLCEDLDVEKTKRLYQWGENINNALQNKVKFTVLYVKQELHEKYTPKNFEALVRIFHHYKIESY